MTVLTAISSAMVRLVGRRPTTIFGTSAETEVQLADLANEVATDIMKGHDWRALTKIHTLTGDGTTTEFDLPSDYDRMVLAQGVDDRTTWLWQYTPCPDLDTWINLFMMGFNAITPGWWIILGGKMQFYPAPPSSDPAIFPYISNLCVNSSPEPNTGVITPQTQFVNDNDTFVLDESLITLGVVWRYREQKGLGYSEDMQTYEIALSQAQARDKGSRVIRSRGRRGLDNTHTAWPWLLG